MIKSVFTFLLLIAGNYVFAQSKEEREIIAEGTRLYRSEMASWYGTDIFLAQFGEKRKDAGGYFSYLDKDRAICVFFSNEERPKILFSITFDSTYNVNTALIDAQVRELTGEENDLLVIRKAAMKAFQSDSLFRTFKDTNPNFIPLNDEKGKRVYILTGPQKEGVVIFGNDYLLTFNRKNEIKEKKRVHKNIIPIEYGTNDDQIVLSTMHSHLPETGDLITATDICTLKLYSKFANWGQHYVISQDNVSIWDCKKENLLVMTRKAWDKIYDDQKERNSK